MPVYRLTDALAFPPPHLAEEGLLAVGGDLSVQRLVLAYSMGIFPWYSGDEPILWWSPDPRMMLFPSEFHLSRSLARVLKRGHFRITFDTAFERVVVACAQAPRPGQDGTWITSEMAAAYLRLHEAGFAHSIECWEGEELAGGLYGISLGAAFFGESMFSHQANASKVALAALVERALRNRWQFIDCQVPTDHLRRMGAREVARADFLADLKKALRKPARPEPWRGD